MNRQYMPGDIVLGKWTLTRLIGEGSFGRVYEAERQDFGRTYKAAIKIVTIPQSQSEIQSVRGDGMDEASVTAYFRGLVEEMVDEFDLMEKLKGTANVVGYEDHEVVEHSGELGWDILIRMELLTPLLRRLQEDTLSQSQILRLGIDLCRALELCHNHKILHRDIKPENIFLSDNGDYKLGDFGIARTVEKTTGGLSKKGTYTYMAPEVYKGEPYGSSADLYSLGLVLYWLTNGKRGPFFPPYPQAITYSDREAALRRRMSGEALPPPCSASPKLAAVILRACAYTPKDRYAGPWELREALDSLYHEASSGHGGQAQSPLPSAEPEPLEKTESVFPRSPGPDPVAADADATESVFSSRAFAGRTDGGANTKKTEPKATEASHSREKEQRSAAGNAAGKEQRSAAGNAAGKEQRSAAGKTAQWQERKIFSATFFKNTQGEGQQQPGPRFADSAAAKGVRWPLAVVIGLVGSYCAMTAVQSLRAAPVEVFLFPVQAILGLLLALSVFTLHTQQRSAKITLLLLSCIGFTVDLSESDLILWPFGLQLQIMMTVLFAGFFIVLWWISCGDKKRQARTMVSAVCGWALLPAIAAALIFLLSQQGTSISPYMNTLFFNLMTATMLGLGLYIGGLWCLMRLWRRCRGRLSFAAILLPAGLLLVTFLAALLPALA